MSRPLRIFLCCQQSVQRHAVPAYSFWADYFRGALAEAGHTLIEAPACDWAAGLLSPEELAAAGWADRTWTTAVEFLRREHACQPIDFFLSYLFPQQVLPAAIAEIRALGGSTERPGGARAFRLLATVLGWKLARRLQYFRPQPSALSAQL